MTTSTTALAETVSVMMQKLLVDHRDDMFKVSKPLVEIDSDVVKVTEIVGGNNYTAVSGVAAPSGSSIRALKSQSAPERFEVSVPLAKDDIVRMGGEQKAAMKVAALLVQNAFRKMAVDFWAFIFGARAIAHPLNGSGDGLAATGGGTVYCVDGFTITTINAEDTVVQTNDHTLALTPTNLRTLLNKRPAFIDLDGASSAPRTNKPWLFVVPELAGTGKNLAEQDTLLFNGAGLQEGFKSELAGVIVVPREATTSADGWGLIYLAEEVNENGQVVEGNGPVLVHIQAMPEVRALPEPGGGATHYYADFKFDVFAHPEIHRDLQYSEP